MFSTDTGMGVYRSIHWWPTRPVDTGIILDTRVHAPRAVDTARGHVYTQLKSRPDDRTWRRPHRWSGQIACLIRVRNYCCTPSFSRSHDRRVFVFLGVTAVKTTVTSSDRHSWLMLAVRGLPGKITATSSELWRQSGPIQRRWSDHFHHLLLTEHVTTQYDWRSWAFSPYFTASPIDACLQHKLPKGWTDLVGYIFRFY